MCSVTVRRSLPLTDRKSTRLNSSHGYISYAVFCLKKKMIKTLENAVRDNPRTTFIACHYANTEYDLSILGKLLDQYPNLYADIAARYGEVAPIPRDMNAFFSNDPAPPEIYTLSLHDALPISARHRIKRIGVVGELRTAIELACVRREACFAYTIAQTAEHALESAQLRMALECLETLHDHLGRKMREPVELFDRHAQRLPQLRCL